MKAIKVLLVALLSMSVLCACSSNKSNDNQGSESKPVDLVGTWQQVDGPEDAYLVLTLNSDGSGSLMTEPVDMGVPLDYEVNGTTITAHLGSVDDNTQMEYLSDTDQIKYADILFSRK